MIGLVYDLVLNLIIETVYTVYQTDLIGLDMTYTNIIMEWYKNITFTMFIITTIIYVGLICVRLIIDQYSKLHK